MAKTNFAQNSIQLRNVATNATLAPNAIINLSTTASSNTQLTFDIKNTSSSSKSYNAKRYDVTLNSGADAYFCFAGTCYGSGTTVSPTALNLAAGQSASQLSGNFNMLVADLDEGAMVGVSIVKYTFVNTQLASDSIQVTLRYNSPTTITKNNSIQNSLSLFPNPCSNHTILKFDSESNVNTIVKLFNSVGSLVFEKTYETQIGNNTYNLNFNGLATGVYFVAIENVNNKTTKKLVIK